MASNSTDFLRFSAYSIKELITRKLSENSNFTDQVYEGSNLAILIDLVSYMYQCLTYVLNNAAAESMFSDAQIYENISRLVEMIGYNPRGCTPASMTVYINDLGKCAESSYQILPFTVIDTGITDSTGRSICFSTVKCGQQTSLYDKQALTLYNGVWKLYQTVFTASGVDYEKFTLDGIKSDSDEEKYVSQKFFKIYVQTENVDGDSNSLDTWSMDDNNLFAGFGLDKSSTDDSNPSFSKLYTSSSKVFQVLLNKEKTYELRFGNGFTGSRLNAGDKVYVFYLDTNGEDGNINFEDINSSDLKFRHDNSMFGISNTLYSKIFPTAEQGIQNADAYTIELSQQLDSEFVKEEDVEDVRQNAPNWFKTGNRLITREDYEYFVKNEYPKVIDVKCMNNWEMLAKFYKWLFDLGENPSSELTESGYRTAALRGGYTYISRYMLESRNYKYIDAADSNNIYLWTELTDNLQITSFDADLVQNLQYIKMLTSEIYAMTPIHVNFYLCASPTDVELERIYSQTSNDTYLEVTLDDNCIYVASTVQIMIVNIITDYFSKSNCQIGQLIDNNDLLNQIYQINGVKSVRTIYDPSDSVNQYRIYQGICFSSYSADLVDAGEDLLISNISRKLQDFQFPHLEMSKSKLLESIKVIKKQLSSSSPIKF